MGSVRRWRCRAGHSRAHFHKPARLSSRSDALAVPICAAKFVVHLKRNLAGIIRQRLMAVKARPRRRSTVSWERIQLPDAVVAQIQICSPLLGADHFQTRGVNPAQPNLLQECRSSYRHYAATGVIKSSSIAAARNCPNSAALVQERLTPNCDFSNCRDRLRRDDAASRVQSM